MDNGGSGFNQRVVFCGRCGAFGLGGFVDATEAVSRQLWVFHVAGSGLSADIRLVRTDDFTMEHRDGQYGFPVFSSVFIVFHHGNAQYGDDAFIRWCYPFDAYDRHGDRLGHRAFACAVLFEKTSSASAACTCEQAEDVAVERLDVGIFTGRRCWCLGLPQNRTPFRAAGIGNLVHFGRGVCGL